MRQSLVLLTLLICWQSSVPAASDIILRAEVQPTEPWVGQRVILRIEVLGADAWAQITQFGLVQLPGAYVIQTESQGIRLQETIDGVSYTGQRYALSVFPQKGGPLKVPSLPVEVTVRTWGGDGSEALNQAQTPELTMDVRVPPGAEGIRDLASTSQFNATQQWEPQNVAPRVGDAIQRTIIRQAADVSGMALAPIDYPELPGVGVYPAEPEVEDATDRGSLDGRRVESVTYVFEGAGAVEIPDVTFSWWNVTANRLESVTLAGLELEVLPGPAAAAESVSQASRPGLWLATALLFAAALLLWRFAPAIVGRWRAWQDRRPKSEPSYFKQALSSVGSNDAKRALRDIMRWLDLINERDSPAQLQEFIRHCGNEQDRAAAERLVHSATEGTSLTDAAQLADALKRMRTRCMGASRAEEAASRILPELNGG
jgi:hypothetical protein